MVDLLQDALHRACKQNGLTLDALSGVGLGVAGLVDALRGLVYRSPMMTARNVPLRDLLAARLPMPVFLDYDANLVARAEQLFGEGQGVSDFMVETIEEGASMAIVIDNHIYRGARGCGAEFGHTKVQLDGTLCRCGQRGCLEAHVSDYALMREAGTVNLPENVAPLEALYQLAKGGDGAARLIFQWASRMFALGLANIINTFDPKLIILSGERMQFDYFYAQDVLDAVKSSVLQIDAPLPDIRIHKWAGLMWAKGAAAYAMEGVSDMSVLEMGKNAEYGFSGAGLQSG